MRTRHFLLTVYEDGGRPLERAAFVEELMPYRPDAWPRPEDATPEPLALEAFPGPARWLGGGTATPPAAWGGHPTAPSGDPTLYPVESTYLAGSAVAADHGADAGKICVFPTLRAVILYLRAQGYPAPAIARMLRLPLATVRGALAGVRGEEPR